MEEAKILVIYIGVAGIRSEDIADFTRKVATKIIPDTFRGEVIILPVQSLDTRIECINPQYITDADLIKEHTDMMEKLQVALHEQLELLKNEKTNEQET
jgi:hypothetical protein